jgi:hypothetical protein
MAIVINGSGTVTGISVGGLPDGIVDAGTLATNSVDSAELVDGSIDNSHLADDAVDSDEIAAGAIDAAHLASGVGGKLLQVVSSTTSGTPHTSSNSYVDTGVTLNITPSATSSKILVTVTAHIDKYTGSTGSQNANSWSGQIVRDSTQIISQTGLLWTNTNVYNGGGLAMSKLDSPSTTSQITYKLQQATTNSGETVGLRGGGETITAMEIGA